MASTNKAGGNAVQPFFQTASEFLTGALPGGGRAASGSIKDATAGYRRRALPVSLAQTFFLALSLCHSVAGSLLLYGSVPSNLTECKNTPQSGVMLTFFLGPSVRLCEGGATRKPPEENMLSHDLHICPRLRRRKKTC